MSPKRGEMIGLSNPVLGAALSRLQTLAETPPEYEPYQMRPDAKHARALLEYIDRLVQDIERHACAKGIEANQEKED